MVSIAKPLRALMAIGDFASVKSLVQDNIVQLSDNRVRRDYVRALDALGERDESERILALQANQFVDDAHAVDAYLKRELERVSTPEELEVITSMAEACGPAVVARRSAMELSMGLVDDALRSATQAIRSAATTQQAANLAGSLGDLLFWHGWLDLVDGVIDLVDLPHADRTWLKAQRRFQLDFSEHSSQLMRQCLGPEHPNHVEARRAWFDHRWVELGPSEELLAASDAWRAEDADLLLEACRISMARQLGMEEQARRMVEQTPGALAWHPSFLSLLDFVDAGAMNDDERHNLEVRQELQYHLKHEGAPRLQAELTGGRLAIVGSAPSELGLCRGDEIDAYDAVVRFRGGGATTEVVKDYGQRTTVHVLPIANAAGGPPVSKDVLVHFTVPYPTFRKTKWEKALRLRADGHSLAVNPGGSYSVLVQELKRPPSSGVRVFGMAKEARGSSEGIGLFGFSAFAETADDRYSFYGDFLPSQHHDYGAEAKWLRREFSRRSEQNAAVG